MIRKSLVGILILAGVLLIASAFAAPAWANPTTAQQPPPQPQSPQAPNALPVFRAVLTGKEEVPAVDTIASGLATFVLDQNLTTLHYRLSVENISNITAAHIHFGKPGVSGDIVFPLYDGSGTFSPGNPISGTLTLTSAQVSELIVGNYYVNVHTTIHPNGEIRGQLGEFTPPTQFYALMTGLEETPPVTTTASGTAQFTLNASMDKLSFQLSVSNILTPTAAHLHTGWPGQPGPVVIPLYTGGGGFDATHPLTGTVSITPVNLLDLLTGYLFANVHTAAHPAGEIRGQVGSGFHAFDANLNGQNEVPPVATQATARAVMVLDRDLSTLHYRLSITDSFTSTVTAAHIHFGRPEENGPIIFPLYSGSGTFDAAHSISGTLTLTDTKQVNDLIAGNYYVNIHTAAHPDGEARGQLVELSPASRYTAQMTGAAEVPPVNTFAYGSADFWLRPGLDQLEYELRVANISNITAAHLHMGLPGQAGPPVVPLYNGTGIFGPGNPLRGTASLSAKNLLDLLTGWLYVNVHTQAYPEGEIRGQISSITQWRLFFPMIFKP